MQDMICEALGSSLFSNPYLKCVRNTTPSEWPELFSKVTPWLWDLDQQICYQKNDGGFQGKIEWDWERLIRMVTRKDASEVGGCTEGVPLALRIGAGFGGFWSRWTRWGGKWRTEDDRDEEEGV